MLGELYMEMGDFDRAQESFSDALELCKTISAPLERAAGCYNLGVLYKSQNQRGRARHFFEQALAIYRHVATPEYQQVEKARAELKG
jgi:tetratricopeptide (TPR) repeat protein